ncbi:MAG: TetR/AcrR family transcriptional regulator [Acidimicrobiales bacterium]
MRAHIAGCALELFRSDGYAGVSMRRLAGSAGCTPMTLYKYFENKFEILQLIWADVFVELSMRSTPSWPSRPIRSRTRRTR